MRAIISALRPLLLAAADLAAGAALYSRVSAAFGAVLVAAGVLVLVGVVVRTLPRRRRRLARLVDRVRSGPLAGRPVARQHWTRL